MNRRAAPLALMGVGLLVALTACAAPNHGRIHDKKYDPAYQYSTTQCYSYRSNGSCAMSMPEWHTEPAHYYLDLYATAKDHGWHEVTPDEYQRYTTGQEYP